MKKKGFYEFDPVIYPRMLWVHIGEDLPEVVDLCFDSKLVYGDPKQYFGVTYRDMIRKDNKKLGILVSFPKRGFMTMGNICHEAMHVTDDIELVCGIRHGDEPSAYIMGWVGSCINKARLGQGNFVEVCKQNEQEEKEGKMKADFAIGEIISFSLKNGHKVVGCYKGISKENGISMNPCIMRNAKPDGEWVLNADEKGRLVGIVFARSAARNLRLATAEEKKIYLEATKKYDKTRKS